MKAIHKLLTVLLALVLAAALAGCRVTSPEDPEFQKDWDESSKEIEDAMEEVKDSWDKVWSGWNDENQDDAKKHRWEIQDADGSALYTIDADKAVQAIDGLLSDNDETTWHLTSEEPGEAAYSYVYSQEKTRLAGQDPDAERNYETLMRFTVSKEKDIVTMTILEDLEGLPKVPGLEDLLTFSAKVPAETAEALRNPSQFEE